MNPTVPKPAALLLDFIASIEAPKGYDTIYGNNHDKLSVPITARSLDVLIQAQSGFTKRFGSSASGRYQFMRNTLRGLKGELGLTGGETFTPDLQDRLAFHLLERRGYSKFLSGRISRTEFGKRLAQEWASFPVLQATKGARRHLKRGQSYYTGDSLNKALVAPAVVERKLDLVMKTARGQTTAMGMGARGTEVEMLQQALKALGYNVGTIDGEFGPITRAAVLDFQARNGLPTTGVADGRTLATFDNAPHRPVDAGRLIETEDDLANKGSRTVRLARNSRRGGILTVILGALGFSNQNLNLFGDLGANVGQALGENGDGAPSLLQALAGLVRAVFGVESGGLWLVFLVLGCYIWNRSNGIAARRLADHRSGANLGR